LVATTTMAVSYLDRQVLGVLAFSYAYLVATPIAGRLIERIGVRPGVWVAVAVGRLRRARARHLLRRPLRDAARARRDGGAVLPGRRRRGLAHPSARAPTPRARRALHGQLDRRDGRSAARR